MSAGGEGFDDVLAEFQNSATQTSMAKRLTYFAVAFVVAVLPVYLYVTPMFDLQLSVHAPYFLVVTAVASLSLTFAYEKEARSKMLKLIKERNLDEPLKKGTSADEQKEALMQSTEMEAAAYSVFYKYVLWQSLLCVKHPERCLCIKLYEICGWPLPPPNMFKSMCRISAIHCVLHRPRRSNVVFLGFFLLLGFYTLPRVMPDAAGEINYAISVGAAGLIAAYNTVE